jgi:hypothetical protein
METALAFALCYVVVGAGVGLAIADVRGIKVGGAVLGAVLGPIGWLILLCLETRPRCPACLGRVNVGARQCCHCAAELPAPPPPEPQYHFEPAPELVPVPAPRNLTPHEITCHYCGETSLVPDETPTCPHCAAPLR